MSRTTQFVSVPLAKGNTSAFISMSVYSVGGAKIEGGKVIFQAGPDLVGAPYQCRTVLIQDNHETVPPGYKSAGEISYDGEDLAVLVEIPH